MKNQLLKLMFIVVCLGFMSSGCEKDTTEIETGEELPFSSRTIKIKDVPEIKAYFEQTVLKYQLRSFEDSEIVYDLSKVIETTSKEGLKNYIISYMQNDTPINEFNNLIINVLPNGDKKNYTCKYICNINSFEKFARTNFDFNHFDGIAEYNFLDTQANRDIGAPCPPVTIPYGSAADGHGENPTNFNGTFLTSNLNGDIYYGTVNNSNLNSSNYGFSLFLTGGGGSATGAIPYNQGDSNYTPCHCYQSFRKGTDSILNNSNPCPPIVPEGYLAPNVSQAALNALKTALGLTPPQWRWFTSPENQDKFEPFFLAYFSDPTLNTPETKAFFKESLDRMIAEPDVFKSIEPFIIEKKINDTDLDPCAKNVLTQLKNTTVCDIAQVLAKLDANAEVYNTTIITAHNSYTDSNGVIHQVTTPANAVPNLPFNYTIYINPDYSGKTKLFRAALILHELVHTYFFSLKDDYFRSNPPNLTAYNDFAALFHYYVTLNHPLSINPYDVHHQQMATDYVDAIARALQEYQTGLPVPDTSQPNQIYSDLAWFGLNDTPVFDNMFPVGNPNLQRILNRGAAEQNGTTIGAGTPNSQSPIGQPCN